MTKAKKAPPGRARGKLKLKKETLKDLDVKGKAKKVKGGVAIPYPINTGCIQCYSASCPLPDITHWYRPC